MKLLFRSLFALLALTFSVNLYAQDVITGTVLDDRGEPVIGGGVVYVGTDIGVVTDIDGHFSIKRLPGKTLQFSSIGMQTMEIVIDKQTELNIKLKGDSLILEDAVVIGSNIYSIELLYLLCLKINALYHQLATNLCEWLTLET